MFLVGLINNIGIGIFVAYTSSLANYFGQNFYFVVFEVGLQAVPILAIIFNSSYLIKVQHQRRLKHVCVLFLASYLTMAYAIFNQKNETSLYFAFAACIIYNFSRWIGEATVMGYIKGIPQELVVPFSSGTGAACYFASITRLMLFEFGLSGASYLLLPGLLIVPLYQMFMWIEGNRKEHYKQKAFMDVTQEGFTVQLSEV